MAAGDAMVTDDDKAVASQPGSTEEKKEEKKLTVQESLRAIVSLIETCVKTKDTRLLAGRLLRSTATIRAQLKSQVLAEFVKTYLVGADASSSRQFLLSTLEQVRQSRSNDRLARWRCMRTNVSTLAHASEADHVHGVRCRVLTTWPWRTPRPPAAPCLLLCPPHACQRRRCTPICSSSAAWSARRSGSRCVEVAVASAWNERMEPAECMHAARMLS
eukprot:366238-Chlamydomonas_euryale.AAC.10